MFDYQVFLSLGKTLHENKNVVYSHNYDDKNENTNNIKNYIDNYIKKLDTQLTFIKEEINILELEIETLEKKHVELFSNVIKNKKFTLLQNKQKSKISLPFSIINSYANRNDLLEYEKYNLNQITIDKLKKDKNHLIEILERTNTHRLKYIL